MSSEATTSVDAIGVADELHLVIVTGLAGAGKTTALHALEDMGYEAVDNLPMSLLTRLLSGEGDSDGASRQLAIGVDSRTRGFHPADLLSLVQDLRGVPGLKVDLLYFDCDDETLTKRFSETRRRHPLALDRPVSDGILRDREIMRPIRGEADFIYDTTNQTVHDTKRRLMTRFRRTESDRINIAVLSFGFSRGLPRDSDIVFDVRFLQNPHYLPDLKPLTGRDEPVAVYVGQDPNFPPFLDKVLDQLSFLLPLYGQEGKSYLTIAFGCTGGRHRSVFLAELVAKVLRRDGFPVTIIHRDAGFDE